MLPPAVTCGDAQLPADIDRAAGSDKRVREQIRAGHDRGARFVTLFVLVPPTER